MSLFSEDMLALANKARPLSCVENSSHVTLFQKENILCGDTVRLYVSLEDNHVKKIRATVDGCSVCKAAVVFFEEYAPGKNLQEISEIAQSLQEKLAGGLVLNHPFETFSILREYPSRIGCFLLPFEAMNQISGL